jgi:hypothetical protein
LTILYEKVRVQPHHRVVSVHNPGQIPSGKVAIRRTVRAGNAAAVMGEPDRMSRR